jgi:large subunit ribosomal protein L17
MRHLKAGRKLNRDSAHRKAMFRNMVTSLMIHGRIRTTEQKAKELRSIADKIITMGKKVPAGALEGLEGAELLKVKAKRLHYIRQARLWIHDEAALAKVFGEYSARFANRPGGYTRIFKLGARSGDNAAMALIELVGSPRPANEEGSAADDVADSEPSAPAEDSAQQGV